MHQVRNLAERKEIEIEIEIEKRDSASKTKCQRRCAGTENVAGVLERERGQAHVVSEIHCGLGL